MFEYKSIGERFSGLRKSKKDKHGKELPSVQMAQELLDSQCITNYSVDVIRQEIGKVEKGKFPQLFLIEGYSRYFKVTSDYLLGLRETKTIDEDIAMINKTTGLSDESIEKIRNMNYSEKLIINSLLESGCISSLKSALEIYYRQNHQSINIVGVNAKQLEKDEQGLVFSYLTRELAYEFFKKIAHTPQITNHFLIQTNDEFIDELGNILLKHSNSLEQTENRQEFQKELKNIIQKEHDKNSHTDYYSDMTTKKRKRK